MSNLSKDGLDPDRLKPVPTGAPESPFEQNARLPSSLRTSEAILNVALDLYSKRGYGAATLRAIAGRLGFTAPAIYNYFANKDEIFRALQARGLNMLASAVLTEPTDDPVADLRLVFSRYYDFSTSVPAYFTLMYVDPSTPRIKPDDEALVLMRRETTRRIQRCINAGVFSADAIGPLSGVMWSVVHGAAVLRQLREVAPEQNFETVAATGIDTLIAAAKHGLLTDALCDMEVRAHHANEGGVLVRPGSAQSEQRAPRDQGVATPRSTVASR